MDCKIALVDSGIDLELYEKYVTEYIDFCEDKEAPFICDTNGHGTLCCSALLTINPKVEIVVVKVLNEQNQCSSERLILALELLAEKDINIINLSMATESAEYLDKYEQVINRLLTQGKVILASTSNGKHSSILSDMRETVGINGKMFLSKNEYWYQMQKKVQCIANSTPFLLKGMNGCYELFGGNSKATALFCGIISKHWDEMKNLSWLGKEKLLEKYARKTVWEQKEMKVESAASMWELTGVRNDAVYKRLAQLVITELELSNRDISSLYEKRLYEFGITKYNAINLIQRIEEELGIKINYSKVNLYWFYSIDLLYGYITERIKIPYE